MNTITRMGVATIGYLVISMMLSSCLSNSGRVEDSIAEDLLRNDNLMAVRTTDGKVSIRNTVTGKITIEDIELEWTQESSRDSLGVYCSNNKRGYYNMYTGEIAIPAQYRRAWVFSEGLAAVQKNGMIGFINHQGRTVIDFKFPYQGNPLRDFVFNNGRCVVADTLGKCGVIDRRGEWIIRPEYDKVSAFKEYAIVSRAGVRMQIAYDGTVINSFVLDNISRLTYTVLERYENRNGEIVYLETDVDTGLFSYRVGGRCGLMDANCHRLTEPLYHSIAAVNRNMFRATLIDSYSEVILNAKGVVMK